MIMFERRNCVECGQEFQPIRSVHVRCSGECRRVYNLGYSKGYYNNNRSDALVKQKTYYDKWKEAHPGQPYYSTEYRLYYGARDRCKASGLEFTITVEDIDIPNECPVLCVPMIRGGRYAPSLDRKDSQQGYTPDNIWVVSKLANRMKNDSTPDELRRFGEWASKQWTHS